MLELIVVAVDGSSHSLNALALGLELAGRAGARVEAVFVEEPHGLLDAVRRAAPARLEDARARVRARFPDASLRVLKGKLEPTLVAASRDADLLALGGAGLRQERDSGERLDARVLRLAEQARSPLLIAPEKPAPLERVRLAYSAPSGHAIAAAADLARAARLPLEVSLLPDGDPATDEGERSSHALEILEDNGVKNAPVSSARGEDLEDGLRACAAAGDLIVMAADDFLGLGHAVAALGLPVVVSGQGP